MDEKTLARLEIVVGFADRVALTLSRAQTQEN